MNDFEGNRIESFCAHDPCGDMNNRCPTAEHCVPIKCDNRCAPVFYDALFNRLRGEDCFTDASHACKGFRISFAKKTKHFLPSARSEERILSDAITHALTARRQRQAQPAASPFGNVDNASQEHFDCDSSFE